MSIFQQIVDKTNLLTLDEVSQLELRVQEKLTSEVTYFYDNYNKNSI